MINIYLNIYHKIKMNNINPTLREFVFILVKRCLNSCSVKFSSLMNIKNKDDIVTIKRYIEHVKNIKDTTEISVNYIINFRNNLEHNNYYINEDFENKLNLLLLSYINLNRIHRLDNFVITITTFEYIFTQFGNNNFSIIRNSLLSNELVNNILTSETINFNHLKYNNILIENECYHCGANKIIISMNSINELIKIILGREMFVSISINYLRKKCVIKYQNTGNKLYFVGDENDIIFYDESSGKYTREFDITSNILLCTISYI